MKQKIEIIRSLKDRGILLKGTTKTFTDHERGFLNFHRPLMTASLLSMKNILTSLAKGVFIPWGLMAVISATDAAIQNKIFGLGITTLIFSSDEIEDIMKKVPRGCWFVEKRC